MKKQTRQMLNDAEQELLRATEPDRLKKLDEDALLDLHGRVRRARTKYTKLHRRRAAAQVQADRSRTRASDAHHRTAVKAEAFEDALARVSRRLAREAWLSADRLREERLAAARAAKAGNRSKGDAGSKKPKKSGKAKKGKKKDQAKGSKGAEGASATARSGDELRTPVRKRQAAAARAKGRRAQAARDAR